MAQTATAAVFFGPGKPFEVRAVPAQLALLTTARGAHGKPAAEPEFPAIDGRRLVR